MAGKEVYHEVERTSEMPDGYKNNPSSDFGLMDKLYVGIVRDSRDPQHMGRLLVWVPEVSGDADLPDNWLICNYCSPFAGASFLDMGSYSDKDGSDSKEALLDRAAKSGRIPTNEQGKFNGRQSYGMWMVPPDIGNEVVVAFINGDPAYGIWMGCLYQQDMTQMIPGIAAQETYGGSGDVGPVLETDLTIESSRTGSTPKRKAYSPLYNGLKTQGLCNDYARGQSSSSAQRRDTSEVFGVLTPNGNQFVMDDNPDDSEFIRLRTKGGAQILISQTLGSIYAISRDGNTWMELDNDGNVDVYGRDNFSVHAEKIDVNLKAGNDVNIQAGRDINLRAERNIRIQSKENLDILAEEELRTQSGTKTSISSGTLMGITCGSELGVSSVNATKIQANGRIFLNSGSGIQADPALRPNTQTPPGQTVPSDGPCNWQSGEAYADGSNIVARVPQHEPWEGHDMVTPGQRGHVEQAPLDKKLRSGAVSETADKPLDKTTPDGKRFEGKGYDEKGNPIFEQVDFCPEALAPISERSISQKGLDTIKRHEGVRNQVYNDAVGKPTVGVGHLITAQDRASGRFDSGTISDEEVDALLKEDIATIEAGVKRCIKQPLTQEQYDACVSLAFNIGVGSASGNSGFCGSTATQQINSGDYDSVPNSIMRWNKGTVNGKKVVIKGLDNRRKQEAALFAGTPEACAGRPASQPGEVMPQTASSAGFDTSGGQSSLARQNSPDQG